MDYLINHIKYKRLFSDMDLYLGEEPKCEADYSLPTCVTFYQMWLFTSMPPTYCHALLISHRDIPFLPFNGNLSSTMKLVNSIH
jgi:hypothetical protein